MAWPSHFDKLSAGGFDASTLRLRSGQASLRAGRLTTKGCTLYIHKNFRNNTLEQALLAGGREFHERYHSIPVRSSKFTDVYRFGVRFGNNEKVVYLMEYFYRSWWDFVKHFFRSSRAKRAMEAGFMLAENGFESPYVIAMGQRNFAFLTTRSFVATLEVENSRSVYQLVSAAEKFQEKRSFIRAFGRTIGRMHADGIFHGDLRLGNVLAQKTEDRGQKTEDGKQWHFFFLDNERTKRFRRLPARLRLKNLVQINMFEPGKVSNTDRMRFFKEYWAENKESGFEKAALIKKVLKKTGRRLRKKMKSGV
ncbi:MAG: hypothetical protein MUO27_08850 [Sedimentisphaerales bacterium]|nr:hypothetical protein [Sedimentisphaerales bacterium]